MASGMSDWLDEVQWNGDGLVPAIAQDAADNSVLMVAWMNREALVLTVETGHAVYWSRSRKKLWHKGEQSGYQQIIKAIRLDCDNDVILLKVKQLGGITCHTGRHDCFFKLYRDGEWIEVEPVLKEPDEIYR